MSVSKPKERGPCDVQFVVFYVASCFSVFEVVPIEPPPTRPHPLSIFNYHSSQCSARCTLKQLVCYTLFKHVAAVSVPVSMRDKSADWRAFPLLLVLPAVFIWPVPIIRAGISAVLVVLPAVFI